MSHSSLWLVGQEVSISKNSVKFRFSLVVDFEKDLVVQVLLLKWGTNSEYEIQLFMLAYSNSDF